MTENRFDELTKLIGARVSRRSVLKAALGVAAGGLLSRFGRGEAVAASTPAVAPANDPFQRTWARTDKPVADGAVARTWMWGPEAFTEALSEPYEEAPGGNRTVQYFDKARMEDNAYRADGPPWDVTNGLLVVELITGSLQLGDSQFEDRQPAQINVAGDANDPNGPTYATFGTVLDAQPTQVGTPISQRIDRAGVVSVDTGLVSEGVTVAITDDVTNHSIATPFWEFMNSSGVVYQDGQFIEDQLFDSPYFATGRPITEAYWADVQVAGTERLVLMQCFERRCLTYTPGNPDGFVVEAGNVGQHYHSWRAAPQAEVSIGPAPPGVQNQLEMAADDNLKHRQLFQFLTFEGFATVERNATAISGPGLLTTDFLAIEMETSPPNPLQATVIFDPSEDGEARIYALVASAQGSLQYLLAVNTDGFVEPLFLPPNLGSEPVSASQLTGSTACDICLDSCVNLPDLEDYVKEQSLDACRAVAHAVCGTTSEELKNASVHDQSALLRWHQICVMAVGSRCLQQARVSTCQEICFYDCVSCDLCQNDEPTEICCDGHCTNLDRDGNNCGTCGNSCFTGEACCDGNCLDILSNTAHCGACGNACPSGHDCINGVCTPPADPCVDCPGDDRANFCCDGGCTNIDTDPLHCGGCGVSCFEGQTCCDGICLDVMSDDDHCGDCGIECAAGHECIEGICVREPECQNNSDCFGCDICIDGICVDCPGTCCNDGTCVPNDVCCPGLIDCGFGLCCGGNFPICCFAFDYCCSTEFPNCCGDGRCCSAGNPVCCNDGWCCPEGCFCTGNQSCDCPGGVTVSAERSSQAASFSPTGTDSITLW